MTKTKESEIQTEVEELKYKKEQLLTSKKFENRKDVINIVVNDTEELTLDEVNKRIDTFMKGAVK